MPPCFVTKLFFLLMVDHSVPFLYSVRSFHQELSTSATQVCSGRHKKNKKYAKLSTTDFVQNKTRKITTNK